jgi:glycine/D-amino acid oxidase-like deaminating enzyme
VKLPRRNGDVSFWWTGQPVDDRPRLEGHVQADIVIIGAGYTGLWTAYYLSEAAPDRRIVVVEARHVGYGASGRNGGWLTSALAGHRGRMAHRLGRDRVVALQRQMIGTVDEVMERARAEGIDADIVKGGVLQVARNAAQLERLHELADDERHWGDSEANLLTQGESRALVEISGTRGGHFSPHTARLHPVKLVTGLAQAVERRGVTIYQESPVLEITRGRVATSAGSVQAPVVLRCTEGFTARLRGQRRALLPMNSSMIVTAPLSSRQWDEIGWSTCPVVGDLAHAYIYAQRTADGRIALGGRGVPYRYASKTDVDGQTSARTIMQLNDALTSMFPTLRDTPIDHAWSGVLGVPRDWCATISFDRSTGMGHAGGYTGHGVATANLAGRTLRDLVLGKETELTDLPHVNWTGRRWEPEPLRWAGVHSMYAAYRSADRHESQRTSTRTSRIARVADHISGRH